MQKLLLTLFIIMLISCSLVSIMPSYQAHGSGITVNFSGIMSEDATWTPENAYILTGPVTIANGATLTIKAGVYVHFNYHEIKVDGTLIAKGNSTNPIRFDKAQGITFTQSSTSWTEQTGSGSMIEYVVSSGQLLHLQISNASPKISHNSLRTNIRIAGGSPIISNNTIYGVTSVDSGLIAVNGGSPSIANNTLYGESFSKLSVGISLRGTNTALISDNTVRTVGLGIYITSGAPTIARNFVTTDYASGVGMIINGSSTPAIFNNTITGNLIGLNIYNNSAGSPLPTIVNNNIQGNSRYNIYLGQQGVFGTTANSVDAAYNWWGTTDTQTINQTIYDHKNDNTLGTVTYTPILTEPNLQAMPNPNAPTTPTTTPTQTPTVSPTQNPTVSPTQTSTQNTAQIELYQVVVGLAAVIAVLSVVVVVLLRRKPKP